MISPNNLEEIKKTTKEFFQKTTFDVEVNVLPPKDQTISIQLKIDDPQILIGERGQTLAEVQHLLKAILKRKYLQNLLQELALDTATQLLKTLQSNTQYNQQAQRLD